MSLTTPGVRTLELSREWMAAGTALFHAAVDSVDDQELEGASLLPGWSRRHVLAHVGANAEALGRLARWAQTGVPTPMYASPEQRDADIEAGARLAPDFLRTWSVAAAEALEHSLGQLDEEQWRREVTTAQGREVPASDVPWMRAREVMVHAVDLGAGVGFRDLPRDFLTALVDDVVARRSALGTGPALALEATDLSRQWRVRGSGDTQPVAGSTAALAAWLTGRPGGRVRTPDGRAVPALPPWL